jgi:hypothetical protein
MKSIPSSSTISAISEGIQVDLESNLGIVNSCVARLAPEKQCSPTACHVLSLGDSQKGECDG